MTMSGLLYITKELELLDITHIPLTKNSYSVDVFTSLYVRFTQKIII